MRKIRKPIILGGLVVLGALCFFLLKDVKVVSLDDFEEYDGTEGVLVQDFPGEMNDQGFLSGDKLGTGKHIIIRDDLIKIQLDNGVFPDSSVSNIDTFVRRFVGQNYFSLLNSEDISKFSGTLVLNNGEQAFAYIVLNGNIEGNPQKMEQSAKRGQKRERGKGVSQ
jgi:hypothetical protein